jgi:adenylate cyclase
VPKKTAQEVLAAFLQGDPGPYAQVRNVWRHLPSPPRCKLCSVPFEGPGGAVFRHLGFARFAGNPAICNSCIKGLQQADGDLCPVEASLLFADIRGSTAIGERMRPADFRSFLARFYRTASEVIVDAGGIVDKFVGDEAIGLFFKGVSGPRHAAAALEAGRALLERVGRRDATATGPIPVGAAVSTGTAYVGSTGADGVVNDFTALGDVVNTTARLASAAAAGELLVTAEAADAAGLDSRGYERRPIEVRGRSQPVDVLAIHVTPVSIAGA